MKRRSRPHVLQIAGFNRRELIVTIACVMSLSLLAFIWRARSRDLPGRKVCEQNLRQLVFGFNSYEADVGRFPAAARIGAATNDDWIFWQPERLLNESTLASRATSFLGSLRCPGDKNFSFRGYPYSYSMNAIFERVSTQGIRNLSQSILLYEEEAPNDGACFVASPTDALSQRHLRRSAAGFFDGHVEQITKSQGTSRNHAEP